MFSISIHNTQPFSIHLFIADSFLFQLNCALWVMYFSLLMLIISMIVTLFIPADSDRHHNLFNLFLFFIIHSDFYSFLKFRIQISCHIYSVSHFWTPHRHITHLMSYLSIFQLQQLSWSGSFRSFVFLCFVYEWILKFCPLSLYFDFCAIHDNSQVLFVILHFVLFSYACNWNSVLAQSLNLFGWKMKIITMVFK